MSVVARLEKSISTRWRQDLVGDGPGERRHWRTKTAHYKAVEGLLAADPTRPLRWETVVGAVLPKGSRSTFYEVTGAKAAHPLITPYLVSRDLDCAEIGYQYRRDLAVDQLIDETKVWSYWPFRQRWLEYWRDEPHLDETLLATSLELVVAEWARWRPALAAAIEYAPPICAVEDFIVIRHGKLAALRAIRGLADVVKEAVGDDLTPAQRLVPAQRHPEPELLLNLAEKLTGLSHGLRFLPHREAEVARQRAFELLRDAATVLA